MSKELLEVCFSITGSFENGIPNYQGVTGNADQQGISVGICQWCAGQGSLGHLIERIVELSSPEFVNSFFGGVDVASLAGKSASSQKQFVTAHFLPDDSHVSQEGTAQWKAFLSSNESIDAQVALAEEGILSKALALANKYVVDGAANLRVVAFFFDVVTQSGGMSNSRGHVDPWEEGEELAYAEAIEMAKAKSFKTMTKWSSVVEEDDLAKLLLHYGYRRALLSKPEYVWDALSRRGAIACRGGVVHGKMFDFTEVLP